MAKVLNVLHGSIRNWEKDSFLPGKESIIKLAKVFQVEELTLTDHRWKNASLADAAALMTYRLLKKTLNSWIPENTGIRQNVLLMGSPNMISVKPSQNLWELAEYVKNSPPLRKLFRHSDKKIIDRF